MSYTEDDLRDLYDGLLPWHKTFEIMSKPKDDDRFDKYLAILQQRVSYREKILMPLGDPLNVVDPGGERIVKRDCGYEFGDWRQNGKLSALIFSRDDTAPSSSMPCPTSIAATGNGWAAPSRMSGNSGT